MQANEGSLQRGASAVTILGGLVAMITLVFIWLQLLNQSRQLRLTRTYQITEKIQDAKFLEHISLALTYFEDKYISEDERWNDYVLNISPEVAIHVYITLAFFEDIAMLYNENNVSRKLIRRLLKTMIIEYYESSEWFRLRMQKQYGETMYKEFDKIYKKLTAPWWNLLAKK